MEITLTLTPDPKDPSWLIQVSATNPNQLNFDLTHNHVEGNTRKLVYAQTEGEGNNPFVAEQNVHRQPQEKRVEVEFLIEGSEPIKKSKYYEL